MTSPGVINWLRIAFIAMIWGSAFMMMRIALRDFEPLPLRQGGSPSPPSHSIA
jgi:hypothetical protein